MRDGSTISAGIDTAKHKLDVSIHGKVGVVAYATADGFHQQA
jgi:hypothetical protein